ncbi:MAG: hypothetical protein IJS58_00260 [Bacilli bacterium]|nr:hypothetical protein [Bacilli bacterium]
MKKNVLLFLLVALFALTAFVLVGCGDEPEPQPGPGPEVEVKRDVKVANAGLSVVLEAGKSVYVTALGQADFAYMQTIVNDAIEGSEITVTVDNQLKAADLNAGDVVISVLGYTSKGISGDITQTSEIARAKALAEKEGIILILCQLSGKERRGESSDPIISEAVKGADYVFIYDADDSKGADYDKKYSTEWCKGFDKLYLFSDEYDIKDYIEVLLGAN